MPTHPLGLTVVLVGSPNSGKTTLFNWLTGSRFRTVNYAGSTVESHKGVSLPVYGDPLSVADTPGIYSLQPHGREEEVTLSVLTDKPNVGAVVVVIDGTQLNRQLYLVRQVQDLGLPMVLAITMTDLVRESGRTLNLEKLSRLVGAPVVPVDGRLGGGVREVVAAARERLHSAPAPVDARAIAWDDTRIEREIAVAEAWTRQVVQKDPNRLTLDHLRRWDRVLLHPIWGVLVFAVVMGLLFTSIFWVAAPLMDVIDFAFGVAAHAVHEAFGSGWVGDFLGNGVVAGVGAVSVFVPQIFILFVGFSLLEDSGYLARAATIVDRPLHKIGLSGRAFVPLLSGFACAVPAVMACRNIRSPRERWITVFVIPFMTCSARLPVYALLLTFLFYGPRAWMAGPALALLYILGVAIGTLAASVLNCVVRREAESPFLMELPVYRWPKLSFTISTAMRRTRSYILKAGPTIFVFILVLWTGTHFPMHEGASPSTQLEGSLVGKTGRVLEPVFKPMGLDWRAGLGILSAFVAREVFVSSMAVIFSIAEDADQSLQSTLLQKMRDARRPDGQELFTSASVAALIVFFMIALQCLSTTGVVLREMGSWKYAAGQLAALNLLGYLSAVACYHVLS